MCDGCAELELKMKVWRTGTLGPADDLGRDVSRVCKFSGGPHRRLISWGGVHKFLH